MLLLRWERTSIDVQVVLISDFEQPVTWQGIAAQLEGLYVTFRSFPPPKFMIALQDLERRFGKVEVHTPNDGESQSRQNQGDNIEKKKSVEKKKNMFEQMGEGLEQIHPLHVMNEGVKVLHSFSIQH